MSQSASPSDPTPNKSLADIMRAGPRPSDPASAPPGRRTRVLAGVGVLAAVGAAVAVFSLGGTRPTTGTGGPDRAAAEKADPWAEAARRLGRDTDPGAVRLALNQLNSELPANPGAAPQPPTPEAEKALAALVPLTPADLAEVRSAAFTPLDAPYLAECFYLRDAARSLRAPNLPPARLAEQGFAWVCRQVYLSPWVLSLTSQTGFVPTLPPAYVLRRGHGSGLERAYVYLALLQQLGIDGCLLGRPDAADQPATVPFELRPDAVPPRGPFWAVGARAGADVLLFDPWRGVPFPGPDGKGVATLAHVKANPGLLKAWYEDKSNPSAVTEGDVKAAAVFLAVPVGSPAPRLAALEGHLKSDPKADPFVRVATRPADLRGRFTAAAPGGPGLPAEGVRFWNPPADRFAYGRTLAGFLPVEEGGTDRTPAEESVFAGYTRSLVPPNVFRLPAEVREVEFRLLMLENIWVRYRKAFVDPPSPREQLQRGQFQEALRATAEKQEGFQRGLERLRSEKDAAALAEWVKALNELYARLSRARLSNPAEEPAARAELGQFVRAQGGPAQLVIDSATAEVGVATASYLYALAMHEVAERAEARAAGGKENPADAWREAQNAWASHLARAGGSGDIPDRTAHARTLAARADALAGRK